MILVIKKSLVPLLTYIIAFVNSIILITSYNGSIAILSIRIVISISSFAILIFQIAKVVNDSGKVYKNKEIIKINNYIVDWIDKAGKTIILTHDLSWVNNEEIMDILFKKARKNELTIIMKHENDLSKQILENHSIDIRYYEGTGYEDILYENRFTIINWGTQTARLTIPTLEGDYHVNEEYTCKDSIYHITESLVKMILIDIPKIERREKVSV